MIKITFKHLSLIFMYSIIHNGIGIYVGNINLIIGIDERY